MVKRLGASYTQHHLPVVHAKKMIGNSTFIHISFLGSVLNFFIIITLLKLNMFIVQHRFP